MPIFLFQQHLNRHLSERKPQVQIFSEKDLYSL